MKYRGEITVFLSLTLICVLSLVLGLVESARTAGARLYLRMASDSAVSSVMSYYNMKRWRRSRRPSAAISISIWNRQICIRQDGKT